MSKAEILNKLDDILDNARVNEILGRKKEEEKKCDKLLWIFAIIGAVVAIDIPLLFSFYYKNI